MQKKYFPKDFFVFEIERAGKWVQRRKNNEGWLEWGVSISVFGQRGLPSTIPTIPIPPPPLRGSMLAEKTVGNK